jgi:signal transduction histidine kinase
LFILAPTKLNVVAFDLANCEGVDGLLWKYLYLLEVLSVLTATVTSLYYLSIHFLKPDAKTEANKQKILLFFGTAFFLSIYFSAEYIGALWNAYEINLLGPAGMLLFLITITYLIVRYKAFEIKLAAAQVLVLGLIMLVASQLFFVETALTTLLATITLILSSIGGYFLVRSVKREINQREQIEQLASGLEIANDQLKVLDKMKSEFVSIASHQLRSPLTAIRGYSSMLLEGSFGPMPDKAKDAVERISEASRFMASSVEDYLNVSRIQAGNMKYEYSDFNLKDLASRVADDTRQIAIKKGLLLTFKTDMKKTGIVHADIGKTRQIIDNLINNALKYTPKGTIEVLVRDDAKLKKIFVEISDSGIGMSEKTIANMFGKFERASNANEVNVTGTGLGLYIARKMAREMGGDVTAHSQGEGKGSMFRIELALMM